MSGLKSFKLCFHQKSAVIIDDLLFNPKDLPDVKVGDILEIFHPGEDWCHLLLQVKCLKDASELPLKDKDVISISNVIGKKFELRPPKEVAVCIVDPQEVAIDLVELVFKDQYFSRADMWRMRASFMKTCLFHGQKVEFAEMRATVEEIWSKGIRIMCGVVAEETRVTFRSSTAQVNIFIQMSSEMWEFDNYGDLYFEKVVDGYLVDLFNLWKEKGCNHDVTITLFSRTFYEARSIEDFPEAVRECICEDYSGRFYEDFYRVIVQNERYDEWSKPINSLKQIFNEYDDYVLHFHEHGSTEIGLGCDNNDSSYPKRWNPLAAKGILPPLSSRPSAANEQTIPRGWNSTSDEGNFLEVLNMALNVFEKYYLDRCFDRTGKLSIVISPGVGIFDVDRGLMNITKQRTIDCGSSVDLVCMGEQPLYAVPLFKFHNRNRVMWSDIGDDYNIPHWINQSFYLSRNQMEVYDQEKVALNVRLIDSVRRAMEKDDCLASAFGDFSEFPWESSLKSEVPFVDYDEFDQQVFRPFSYNVNDNRSKLVEKNAFDVKRYRIPRTSFTLDPKGLFGSMTHEKLDEKCSKMMLYMSHSFGGITEHRLEQTCPRMIGSVMNPYGHDHLKTSSKKPQRKALVNPFAPSRLDFKVTSNQRRWSHIHPSTRMSSAVHQLTSSSSTTAASESNLRISSPSRDNFLQLLVAADHRRHRRLHRSSECSESSERMPSLAGSCVNANSADSLRDAETVLDNATSRGAAYQDPMAVGTLHHVGSLNSMATACESLYSSSFSRMRTTSLRMSRPASTTKDAGRYSSQVYPAHESRGLWLANEEQEPLTKCRAAMDWKGMAIPASLPLTTDYFPEQPNLEKAFVVADYSLIDEMALSSEAELKQVGRKPLTMRQVFNQMVYQRLAQGFQIVIIPKNSIVPRNFRKGPALFVEQITLSIGRIFHRLTLFDTKVVVMRFWPRHPSSLKTFHYKYRFQVPDSNTYDVSWTDFDTEKLELFNWNYVDHYLITRGEEHYRLHHSHKYWRSRFFLLPCCSTITKQIVEGTTDVCNIYHDRDAEKQMQLMEGFLRFLEVANKLKRMTSRPIKVKDDMGMGRRGSIDNSVMAAGFDIGGKLIKELCSRVVPENSDSSSLHPVLGSEAKRPLSTALEFSQQTLTLGYGSVSTKSLDAPVSKNASVLTAESSSAEIIHVMLDSLTFFKSQQDLPLLPPNCFVSADAVFWAMKTVSGITGISEGILLMERLVKERAICHASGDTSCRFVFGFYLYFVVMDSSRLDLGSSFYERFEHEWCESAIITYDHEHLSSTALFADRLLHGDAEFHTLRSVEPVVTPNEVSEMYKVVHVDVDSMNRSDREEWGWARYHRYYNPNSAYELTVEWLVATGCILGDLVLGWTRKAKDYGFHFLPVPCDPFALPFNPNSDPLRGPIFVPLNVGCLGEDGSELFVEYEEESRALRLALFQGEIVKSFGFLRDSCRVSDCVSCPSLEQQSLQYVHCTGSMFVVILSGKASDAISGSSQSKSLRQQYEEYIARQCNQKSPSSSSRRSTSHYVGFLWAWNSMLTKRWRSINTGDEAFQDRMLSDFRKFCSNTDGRLLSYWNELKELHCLSKSNNEESGSETISFSVH